MKTEPRVTVALAAVLTLLIPAALVSADDAGEDWKSLKAESKRIKINEMADGALDQVMNSNWKAQELFESAYGWAAFDNLKIAFLLSGGGGNGVVKQT